MSSGCMRAGVLLRCMLLGRVCRKHQRLEISEPFENISHLGLRKVSWFNAVRTRQTAVGLAGAWPDFYSVTGRTESPLLSVVIEVHTTTYKRLYCASIHILVLWNKTGKRLFHNVDNRIYLYSLRFLEPEILHYNSDILDILACK